MSKVQTRAERNIAWCEEHIKIPEGQHVGNPLVMAEFMKEDFRAIYDNPDRTRLAIITRGRKNAKTTESAMIVLLHLVGPEALPNSQINSAAQSRDQAAILFKLAAKMIRQSQALSEYITIKDTAKELVCAELGTVYKALSAEASTAFGLSPALIIHDELGQVRGPKFELYEALETATAAQANPLSIVISTQAPNDDDLLSLLIEDAKTGRDPRTVLRMDTAPEELETFSEAAIRAANPAFDLFMNKEVVLKMASDAQAQPSMQAGYENLVLNRRVEANNPFISRQVWKDNGKPPVHNWSEYRVVAGLDLSATTDLTALVIVGVDDEGDHHVEAKFWTPKDTVIARSKEDRVGYDQFVKDGFIEAVTGSSIDYDWIAQRLVAFIEDYGIEKIAFDRWNFRHLRPCLVRAGMDEEQVDEMFMEFGQGYVSMSPALRQMETLLLNKKIRHGNNPVLTMCAANSTVQEDAARNRKLIKVTRKARIDGMIAAVMAVAAASEFEAPEVPASTPWDDDPEFRLAL